MEKIAKYELREVLGRGGMGVVYRAYDPLMDREVAIKVILDKVLESTEIKARFVREARTAGRLSHENIMVIYDLGDVEGKTYIVMEYLHGKDLRFLIDQKEPLTLREKLGYARQICRGLQYAHTNMIVHRDIKPDNIRVLRDGRVKIMDFGIAKPYAPVVHGEDADSGPMLTRAGMRVGTPWYMSPEQVKGAPVDRRADIFSFGVVLYELLTYRKPFEGDDTTVMYKILHEEPEPIHFEDSGLSDELQRVLSHCLAKDPDARYPDCLAVLRDLDLIPEKVENTAIVQDLLKEGEELTAQDRLAEATMKFEEILALDPKNREARSSLMKLSGLGEQAAANRVLNGKIVGDVISHFQILERIGAGGMGVVYKAEDVTLKRIVALKFLLPDRTLDQTAKKRFLKEARAASALDHPNICAIHEISETTDGLVFICMAYYGDENLSKRIHAGPLPVREAVSIAIRIARGLAKAHEHGIVHRDIKPANIIITGDGEAKIVDFGLAKLSDGSRITKIGSAMGTLPFMSPEQIKGQDPDHRTDIWSFGVMLYQVLTGKLPFRGDDEVAIPHAILTEEPARPSTLRPGIPQGLEEIIEKALKKKVNDRYASMTQVLADLEALPLGGTQPELDGQADQAELDHLLESGKSYMQRKLFQEALTRFEAALKVFPNNPRIIELRDQCLGKIGEARQVETWLKDAKTLVDREKFKEARGILQGVMSLSPDNPEARVLLNTVYEKIEHFEGLDKLLSDADFYLRHAKFDDAAECFRKILEVDPANKEAARGLRRVEKGRGQDTKREAARTPVPSSTLPANKNAILIATTLLVIVAGTIIWFLLRPVHDVEKPPQPAARVDSAALLAVPKNEMLAQRANAGKANAARWAPTALDSAQRVEQAAEGYSSSHNYSGAKAAYEAAGTLYKGAADEAKRLLAAASSSLTELSGLVSKARDEMLVEKTAAENAGGKRGTPAIFNDALAKERAGDKHLHATDRDGLLAARTAYGDARIGYSKVVSEVSVRSELKRDADARRAEMNSARQGVPGTEQDRKTNSAYRNAAATENQGHRLYQSGDYRAARDAFAQAAKSYSDAGNTLVASRTNAKPPADTERRNSDPKEPERKDKDERDASQREIQRMIASYKEQVERGNLQGLTALLNLGPEQQSVWSDFFGASEERKVAIDGIEMEVNRDDARVHFRVRSTFVNKAANTTQNQEYNNTWLLEPDNGKWKVVKQK